LLLCSQLKYCRFLFKQESITAYLKTPISPLCSSHLRYALERSLWKICAKKFAKVLLKDFPKYCCKLLILLFEKIIPYSPQDAVLIDEQIQKAVDPIHQWERLRRHLLECGVSTAYVAKLEDKYVRAIKTKNFEDLIKLADGTNDKARGLIADFTASVCAKVILGSI